MKDLQNLSDLKSSPKERTQKISEWKDYYKRQRVIRTAAHLDSNIDEEIINLICRDLEIDSTKVEFIVSTPVTFFHLNDFKSGLKKAATFFLFMKNGEVITEENSGIGTVSYDEAYREIVKRAVGLDVDKIIPEVTKDELLSEEEEKNLFGKLQKYKESLKSWIEKFEILPSVQSVDYYSLESPGRLIEVNILTNFPRGDSYESFTLNIGDEVEDPQWGKEGLSSDLYDKWRAGLKLTSWLNFYNSLLNLSDLYLTMPDSK